MSGATLLLTSVGLLAVCLFILILLLWSSRRASTGLPAPSRGDQARAPELAPPQRPSNVGGPLRDLSSLASGASASTALPGSRQRANEPTVVQPGEGPVSVSGPGGVTWAERNPQANIFYETTGGTDIDTATPAESEPEPVRTPEPRDDGPRPSERTSGRARNDKPDEAFDPPGQYR